MNKLIKWPPLHKALTKNGELTVLSDYIYVHNYCAIIVNPEFSLIVNLKEKFSAQADPNAVPDYNYENALDTLEFLNDKLISGAYWEELVDAQAMLAEPEKGYIHITSKGTSNKLFHIEPAIIEGDSIRDALLAQIGELRKYSTMERFSDPVGNISHAHVKKITDATKSANGSLILESLGPARPYRFTFENHRDVFGIIYNDRNLNEEMFLNHNFAEWNDNLDNLDPFERIDYSNMDKEPEHDADTQADLFQLEEKNTKMEVVTDLTEKVKNMEVVDAEVVKKEAETLL